MRKLFICLVCILVSLSVKAQVFPKIGKDPAIQTGTLPNGLSYYIIPNKASKGYADYAIVQKIALNQEEAKQALVTPPSSNGIVPYRYLASKGVGYGRNGFFKSYGRSSCFRFEKVPVADVATSDTTLMILFGLCAHSPYEQAVVISGDVDASNLKGKISIFSLMVTQRTPAPYQDPYEWKAKEFGFESNTKAAGKVASVSVTFYAPRVPEDQLQTVQTLVTAKLYKELSMSLERRIKDAFRSENIPLAGVYTSYLDSSHSIGDESLTIKVDVDREDVREAVSILSEVLYMLDEKGIGKEEMEGLQKQYDAFQLRMFEDEVLDNEYYVNKCISSYLYGTDLGPISAARDFFSTKVFSAEIESGLLSSFASALIDPRRNVTLTVDSPSVTYSKAEMVSLFRSGWSAADSNREVQKVKDIKVEMPVNKVKVKTETAEPMSGGVIWTYSNGMRVIYKHQPSAKELHYALLVKGSYSDIKTIAPEEGPFISDALSIMNVGEHTPEAFSRFVDAAGMSVNLKVDLSDLRITGTAPSDGLDRLMRTLLALTSEGNRINEESFAYYRKCEALRLDLERNGHDGQMAAVDSIMRPGFAYSPYRKMAGLTDNLPGDIRNFFDRQFSRTNDGILIILGNLEPEDLQKELCKYLGGFSVGKGFSIRPDLDYSLRSGWSTYLLDNNYGEGNSINVVMSYIIPITAQRYMANKVAQLIFRRELVNTLSRYGMWVDVQGEAEFIPKERISLKIFCRPTDSEGLPKGVTVRNPVTTLAAVRASLELACHKPITDAEMAIYKSILLSQVGYDITLNSEMMNNLMIRYSEGKDLVSQYKEVIESLTPASIQEVLTSLTNGSKVEFVVK